MSPFDFDVVSLDLLNFNVFKIYEVQAEIAGQVEEIYREAKQLREDGAEILRQAKREVERMILCES